MKATILSIAGGSILLTSIAISGEATVLKTNAAEEGKPATVAVVKDPAVTLITNDILNPVIKQAKRTNGFSRSFRPINIVYELVEVTETTTEEARFFNIINKYTSSVYSKTTKAREQKEFKNTIHEIKYLTASNKALIKQGSDWVAMQDHKYLRLLPKTATPNNVVANKQ